MREGLPLRGGHVGGERRAPLKVSQTRPIGKNPKKGIRRAILVRETMKRKVLLFGSETSESGHTVMFYAWTRGTRYARKKLRQRKRQGL